MKKLLLLQFLLLSALAVAKPFHKAVLVSTSGAIKQGFASVPNHGNNNISFKENLEGKTVTLPSDDFTSITFLLEDGSAFIVERAISQMVYINKSGKLFTRKRKNKSWYFVKKQHDKLNMYMSAQKYKIDKNNEFILIQKDYSGSAVSFPYYFRRPNEAYVTHISTTKAGLVVGFHKMFRTYSMAYFNDRPTLQQKIKDKGFPKSDIYKLYDYYISNF